MSITLNFQSHMRIVNYLNQYSHALTTRTTEPVPLYQLRGCQNVCFKSFTSKQPLEKKSNVKRWKSEDPESTEK